MANQQEANSIVWCISGNDVAVNIIDDVLLVINVILECGRRANVRSFTAVNVHILKYYTSKSSIHNTILCFLSILEQNFNTKQIPH